MAAPGSSDSPAKADEYGGVPPGGGRDRPFGHAVDERLWSKFNIGLLDSGTGDDLAAGHPFEFDADTLVSIERTLAPPA